jgi:predicted amidohydrolase
MDGHQTRDLIVAVAQTASVLGDVCANVAVAAGLASEAAAAGASLMVSPELSLVGYQLDQLADPSVWITADDPRLGPLRQRAQTDGITIAVSAPVLMADGQRRLGVVVLTPDGAESVHGKQFLAGHEVDWFDPAPTPMTTLAIGGWQVALAVCFDAAVPQHAANAAALGADVYVGSALYVEGEERRVDIHFASRAMDHRMYAVLANHSGPTSLGRSLGGSGAWSPTGDRVHEGGTQAELVVLTLERSQIDGFRHR